MSTAAIVAGTAAAGLAGSAISANGAENAASTQAASATQAQTLQAQEAQNALNFQEQQYNTGQQQLAPYLAAGQGGLSALQYGLGTGGSANGSGVGQDSLTQGYGAFTAPTTLDEQNDPGYQARLTLGTTALQNSAAARGSVLTGGTAKALDTYAQDYASNEYSNVYNRALQSYGTNATNYYTNQGNQYNRLAALANTGQQATNTSVAQGQNTANQESNIDLTTGAQQGQDIQNAGAATASGIVGSANAYSSGLTGASGQLTNLALLNSLNNSGANSNIRGFQNNFDVAGQD